MIVASRRNLESLVERVDSLRRFVAVSRDYLPEDVLAPARSVVDRAGERLALSRDHTVVALAGPTGSGKSSLFNALAAENLSTVGVRRPTTSAAHACAWGPGSASELLDWLGVTRRFSGAHDDATLSGLVLVDLPDFDSVEATHRLEVDRLLALVDLVVWVLDPQKYADKLVHKQYLAQFHRHRDITVVALNQADLLEPAETQRCLEDLRRLVDADGLGGVPVLMTSAVGSPGIGPLRETLERAVAARLAALHRLSADVDGVVDGLQPFVSVDAPKDAVDRETTRALTDALAVAAGVPVVARATERAYVHRAIRSTGWPVTKWVRRLRPDPLGRLRLGRSASYEKAARLNGGGVPVGATSIPPAAPAAQAVVGLALRTLAERAGRALPEPWPAAVLAAARSHTDDLTDALDVAITRTDLGLSRLPLWWRAVGVLQWLTALAALVGLFWLGVRLALFAFGLPELVPAPRVGQVQVPALLFFGGLLAGLLVSVVVRPIIVVAARRKGSRAAARMRDAIARVASDLVLAPVRAVLRAYADARAALRAAAPPP